MKVRLDYKESLTSEIKMGVSLWLRPSSDENGEKNGVKIWGEIWGEILPLRPWFGSLMAAMFL